MVAHYFLIVEQLTARNKELKAAVDDWDDNDDQLKDAEHRLAAGRQRIAELEQASEELQQDAQFAKEALFRLEEEQGHQRGSGGKPAVEHCQQANLPGHVEGSRDIGVVPEEAISRVAGSRAVQTGMDQESVDEGQEVARDESRKRKADAIDDDGEAKSSDGGVLHVESACDGVGLLPQDNRDESGSDTAESGSSAISASATRMQPFGGSRSAAASQSVDGAPLTPATRPRRDSVNRSR